ncbi:MAG: hypothetical protein HA496_06735 [Thaumarchaeota archaeon]|jgi:hypothetical protein|nr:hypothetical protein [Nitrososphaerota archaeon]
MPEDSVFLKKLVESWRANREKQYYPSPDIESLMELLSLVKSELQLVDKTSIKRGVLEWYYDAVKSILEDAVKTRLIKSLLLSVKSLEKMAKQDLNSLSKFLTATPEEFDLRLFVSQPFKNRDKKTLAIVLKDIERFVGEDGREYGPYRAGCLVNIPYYVARLLEEKGVIEEIFIT